MMVLMTTKHVPHKKSVNLELVHAVKAFAFSQL